MKNKHFFFCSIIAIAMLLAGCGNNPDNETDRSSNSNGSGETDSKRSVSSPNAKGSSADIPVFMSIEEMEESSKTNQIYLDGYICKEPVYRKTPLGREIADLLVAVNRPYGKSDYIPCIAWGRNARYASGFGVGTRILIWGRVQSREYTKKVSETECEKRVAYEVSVSKLECADHTES